MCGWAATAGAVQKAPLPLRANPTTAGLILNQLMALNLHQSAGLNLDQSQPYIWANHRLIFEPITGLLLLYKHQAS